MRAKNMKNKSLMVCKVKGILMDMKTKMKAKDYEK